MKMQSRTVNTLSLSGGREVPERIGGLQRATLMAFGIVTALLLWHVWRYIGFVASLLPLPYSIDYGEGIVMQQAMMIPGPRMYGDINVYPYIVFHYPPFYHLTARAIAGLGIDLLYAGRWLSMVSTAATAALVGALIFHFVRERASAMVATTAAAIGGVTLFTYLPIALWSPIMRVDMLAVMLSFVGVYVAVLGTRRPALLYAAALAFSLGIYTKQTMIAAPVATFGIFWLREPRAVRGPIVFGLSLSLAALACLNWETNGGFLRHIAFYNINRFSIAHALPLWLYVFGGTAIYLYVAVRFGLVRGWQRLGGLSSLGIRDQVRQSDETLILMIIATWFAVSTMTLVTAGKIGGSVNYFIEWMCILSVLIGIAVGIVIDTTRRASGDLAKALLVPFLLAAQLLLIRLPDPPLLSSLPARQEMDHLLYMVQRAQKPVMSDDMVLLLRAGKEVPIEPAIFAELASLGQWDERKLVDLINSRAFAFIVSQREPGRLYDERYTKPVQAAIAANYPHQERYAAYVVMKP
jgi:hypothetical protein